MTGRDPEPAQVVRDGLSWFNDDDSSIESTSESINVYNPGFPDGAAHGRDAREGGPDEREQGIPDVSFEIEELAPNEHVVAAETPLTVQRAAWGPSWPAWSTTRDPRRRMPAGRRLIALAAR